jgi:hypothetical protein
MSKINKKKLKKMLRAQMMATQHQSQAPQSPQIAYSSSQPQAAQPIAAAPEKALARPLQLDSELEENKKETRKEVRKILLTMLALLVIVIAVYLINIKTDIILKTGQFLLAKLNLSI